MMNAVDIIRKYYNRTTKLYNLLIVHSECVANKAVEIARIHPEMDLDEQFIYEAAMIHDIGIIKTNAPEIECFGELPYICHGYIGSEIIKKEGFLKHALVCERHTGTGISKTEIIERHLPLPQRDMMPVSLEEQLICFADKFFSKTKPEKEKSVDKIRKNLSKFGEHSVTRFNEWLELFLG